MTVQEKNILTELCDRIYYREEIDIDFIEGLGSLYETVKRLIKYKPNKQRLMATLSESELITFKKYEND